MTHKKPFRLICLFTIGLLLAGSTTMAQEWSGIGRLKIQVLDEDRQPVEGAKLTFTFASNPEIQPDQVFTTDENGELVKLNLRPGTWVVEIAAEGFYKQEETAIARSAGGIETTTYQLKPLPEEVIEAQKRKDANEYLKAGQQAAGEGEFETAREQFGKALEQVGEKDQPVVLALIAGTYVNEGDTDKAKEILEESLAIDSEHVDSIRTMCSILAAEGKVDEAEAMFDRLPDDTRVHPNTTINLGMAHYNQKEYEAAKRYLDRTIRDFPGQALPYYFRGLTLLAMKDNAAAKSDFERYMALAPEDDPQRGDVEQILDFLNEESGDETAEASAE